MNMNMMMIITFLTLIVSSSSSISLAQVLPSPSPSPSSSTTDCVMVLSSLIDCIEYVIGNGTIAPTPQCCNELSGVFDTNSICLCELYNTSLVDAYGINYTTASNLPSSCNLTDSLPTINQCQAAGIPVAAPSPSTSSIQSPGTSPSSSQSPSGDTLVPPPSSTNTTNATNTTSPNSSSQSPSLDMINGVASMFMLIITVLLV